MRPTRANMPLPDQLRNVRRVLMNIGFGNSNSDPAKNIQGWDSQNLTTPGTANSPFTVSHDLGYVPTRFHVVYNDSAGVVYDSGVAWTASAISLKCSAASATIRVFIV